MKNQYLLVLALASLLFAGCGKDISGTYKGNETVQQNGSSTQAGVTITVNPVQNNNVSGTWASATGTGTFTGTLANDGNSIQGVNVNLPQQVNANTALTGTAYPYGATGGYVNGQYLPGTTTTSGLVPNGAYPATTCSGTYTGSLMIADKKLNGSLSNPSAAANPYCPGMRTVDVTK